MAFKRLSAYNAANTAGLAGKIKDQMVLAGWTLYDDQSGSSPPYYIMKSTGENPTTKVPCYFEIKWSATYADKIELVLYLYWDNVAHSGVVKLGTGSGSYIYADDDAAFYAWIHCNKDFMFCATKLSTTYYASLVVRMSPFYKFFGVLQSSITSGSNKVLQLGAGQTDGAVIGAAVMLACLDGTVGRDSGPVITAIDDTNHQITLDTVAYNFPAGSVVGFAPYPWSVGRPGNSSTFYTLGGGDGTGDYSTGGAVLQPITYTYVDPESLTSLFLMFPDLHTRDGGGLSGFIDRWMLHDSFSSSSNEDTVAVGIIQDDTVATGGGSDYLDDTAQSWDTDEHADKCVILISGTGAGQIRTITTNTGTRLTVDETWSTNPDSTTHYVVCEEGYRHFGFNSTTYARSVIEGGVIPPALCYEITTTTTTTTTSSSSTSTTTA